MAQYIEDIFTEKNMLGYSDACLKLAEDLPPRAVRESLDTLVIPSRGAVPFFLGMTYALDRLATNFGGEHKHFYDNLGVQPMLTKVLPSSTAVANSVVDKKYRVLMIPFTADLNLEKFDEKEDTVEYTTKTRQFWANVTASFFLSPECRERNPYYKAFVDVVLRQMEGRKAIADVYEAFPPIKRFALIDTVISGRASNEILKAFDQISEDKCNQDMRPHAFLVVDQDGKKLKDNREFARYLYNKECSGRANLYRIPAIVSEDKGASLLGVAAVVYPSVMKASKKLETHGREFFVGAGSWFLGDELEEMGQQQGESFERFKRFMNLVYSGIDVRHAAEYGGNVEGAKMQFDIERQDFLDEAHASRIFCLRDPNMPKLAPAFKPAVRCPYLTHSHVLHIPFGEDATRQVYDTLLELPQVFPMKRRSRRLSR